MELRGYFFGHYYLSGMQQGIQGQHANGEVFKDFPQLEKKVKRKIPKTKADYLHQWNHFHKTSIFKNGGNCATLKELMKFFGTDSNPFPWAPFFEDEASLNGALTCVTIVLPDYIFKATPETMAALEAGNHKHPDPWARQIFKRHDDIAFIVELIKRVQSAELAR